MSRLEQLLTAASQALGPLISSANVGCALPRTASKHVHEQLTHLYSKVRNGFYAFESALWVYPVDPTQRHSFAAINTTPSLRNYPTSISSTVIFATDALGSQFAMDHDGCWSLDLETAEREFLGANIEEWAGRILAAPELLTAYPLMHEWQLAHGAIAQGQRLGPRTPFVLGGEFVVDNLVAIDAIELLEFRAHLFQQIHSLPPGSKIEWRIT